MSAKSLRVARGLSLPAETVTKTFAILAQRRKGKTYTASVIAEEMCAAGIPWVALDPTGAWWGLRASADGRREGLPVLVIGGEHGQLPLERTAGKLMADLVVDKPGHYVLDFSLFESKAAEREFATDFAERFYRRKGKSSGPMHLFVDEADMFVPQRSPRGDQRMLGAFEAIVRRGGIRGIGSTLISQRAAVVNKNVLEQIDVLVALRTVGPNDQKALKAYIEAYGTEEEKTELLGSLASLDLGEAWIWEPGTDLFKRVRIRERRTFNSSATPKAGEKRVEPAQLAEVDLEELRERIASTIEKAKADDPKELRKQVRELQGELRKRPAEKEVQEVEKVIEVPVLANGALESLQEAIEAIRGVAAQLATAVDPIAVELRRISSRGPVPRKDTPLREAARKMAKAPVAGGGLGAQDELRHAVTAEDREAHGEGLTGPEQRVLDALAWLDVIGFPRPTKIQVGFIAGYRVGKKVGGTFGNILGQLRGRGLIEYPSAGVVALTDAGRELATVPDIEQTPEGLQRAVMDRLDGPESRVLQVLIDYYPGALSKQEAGELAGYTVGEKVGGTYGNILGRLRSLGLIDYPGPGEVAALPVLFLEGAIV